MYIYVYMYIHIYMCMYIYLYICIYIHTYVYIHIYIHIYVYTCLFIYIHIDTYMYSSQVIIVWTIYHTYPSTWYLLMYVFVCAFVRAGGCVCLCYYGVLCVSACVCVKCEHVSLSRKNLAKIRLLLRKSENPDNLKRQLVVNWIGNSYTHTELNALSGKRLVCMWVREREWYLRVEVLTAGLANCICVYKCAICTCVHVYE